MKLISSKVRTRKSALRAFVSGIGSVINISPYISKTNYKGPSQDFLMLSSDMKKIGNDFRIAFKRTR